MRALALIGSTVVAGALVAVPAAPALAAQPVVVAAAGASAAEAAAATAFNAECPGETLLDPTKDPGPWTDLTLVDLNRLSSYNEGNVVPLYDAYGGNYNPSDRRSVPAYPPLCGVHYDAATDAAVADWMFCTDLFAHACGDTNENGDLVTPDGEAIDPMQPHDGNQRLSAEQQRLIGYLITNGHDYSSDGAVGPRLDGLAVSDGTTDQRVALQMLVWCVSDANTTNKDLQALCAENMNADEQARLLESIPVTPLPTLAVEAESADPALEPGDIGRITVVSNVFDAPIALTVDPAGASIELCSPGSTATLDGLTLTLSGDDPAIASSVELCVTSTVGGSVTLTATATADAADGIVWHQAGDPGQGELCQHFAAYFEHATIDLAGSAELSFTTETETTTTGTTGDTTGTTGDTTGTTGDTTGTTGDTTGDTTGTSGDTTGTSGDTTGTAGDTTGTTSTTTSTTTGTTGTAEKPATGLASTGASSIGLLAGLAGGALLLGALLFVARRASGSEHP